MWPFSDNKVNADQKANNDGQHDGANASAFERFVHDAVGQFFHSKEYNDAYNTAREFKKGQEAGKDSNGFERTCHEAARGATNKGFNDGYDNGMRQAGHTVPERNPTPSEQDSGSDDRHYNDARHEESSDYDTEPKYKSSSPSSTESGDALFGLAFLLMLAGLGYVIYSGFSEFAAWLQRPSRPPGDRSGFGYSVSPLNQLRDIRDEVVGGLKKERDEKNSSYSIGSSDAPFKSPPNTFASSRRYRVVELARGDYLNVREGPGTNTAVVAQLRDGDSGIQITSTPVLNGSTKWVRIRAGNVNGWVNFDLLKEVKGVGSDTKTKQRFSNESRSVTPSSNQPQTPALTINLYCRQCGVTHRIRAPFPIKWDCPRCGYTFDLQKYRYLYR